MRYCGVMNEDIEIVILLRDVNDTQPLLCVMPTTPVMPTPPQQKNVTGSTNTCTNYEGNI